MISQTQINTYINCSKKYQYKYVLRQPPANDTNIDGLFVGVFVHEFINNLNSNLNVNFDTILQKVLTNQKNIWIDYEKTKEKIDFTMKDYKQLLKPHYYQSLFENQIEELKTKTNKYLNLYDTAKEICLFIKDNLKEDIINLKSEERIEVDDLLIIIDGFNISNDFNNIIIKDFKISKKVKDYNKKNVQDLLYVYAIYKKYQIIPIFEYIQIVYSNRNTVDVQVQKDKLFYQESDLIEAEEYLINFRRGVDNNIFIKNVNSFLCSRDYCEYYDICQKYQPEEGKNE